MLRHFLDCLRVDDSEAILEGDFLIGGENRIPVRNGIPRFTPDISYSTGNFSLLRERHATLQLDSQNHTTDRYDTLMERTQWPKDFFEGKTILECGCGVGPDSEILLSLGARVVSVDIAGVDIAQENLGRRENHCLLQASITDLPLEPEWFDIVFCHRVLQHTPDPRSTLQHILQFVKPTGAVFVHSYAKTLFQLVRWKYLLRPLTKRMEPETLYNVIKWYAPAAFKLTNMVSRLPFGPYLVYNFIPFNNYRYDDKFSSMSDDQMIAYGVHDTFDALSPVYDRPISAGTMEAVARGVLRQPFEVHRRPYVTLLRTTL